MAGTVEGGRLAARTNKNKYGEDFYAKIGRMGGKEGVDGGFGSLKIGKDGRTGKERARLYGAKGGTISRRTK